MRSRYSIVVLSLRQGKRASSALAAGGPERYAPAVERIVASLLARADVERARAWLLGHDAGVLELQRAIVRIPAPTGEEGRRGAFVAERFEALGLSGTRVDSAGNVHA